MFSLPATAQIGGRQAFSFLNVRPGTNLAGLGGVNVSARDADATMLYGNPALLILGSMQLVERHDGVLRGHVLLHLVDGNKLGRKLAASLLIYPVDKRLGEGVFLTEDKGLRS